MRTEAQYTYLKENAAQSGTGILAMRFDTPEADAVADAAEAAFDLEHLISELK